MQIIKVNKNLMQIKEQMFVCVYTKLDICAIIRIDLLCKFHLGLYGIAQWKKTEFVTFIRRDTILADFFSKTEDVPRRKSGL